MLCADLVEVSWSREGKRSKVSALLEDISPSGVCLQTEVPIPVGVTVCWRSPKKEFSGTVRYCEYREIGYFTGVQLDSGCKWSKRAYKPQHLLDLKSLAALSKKSPRQRTDIVTRRG